MLPLRQDQTSNLGSPARRWLAGWEDEVAFLVWQDQVELFPCLSLDLGVTFEARDQPAELLVVAFENGEFSLSLVELLTLVDVATGWEHAKHEHRQNHQT